MTQNRVETLISFIFWIFEYPISNPWARLWRGVVVDIVVKEEAITEMMQCKDTCIVRSVVVDKGLRNDDVRVEFFDDRIGVHEMELDIVFAEQPQAASSSVRDDEQDWEEDPLELLGDRAMLVIEFNASFIQFFYFVSNSASYFASHPF